MLTKISWSTYIELLVVGLVVYYGVIALLFYRRELGMLMLPKKTVRPVIEDQGPAIPDIDLPLFQSLTDEVNAYLQEASNNNTPAEQLVFSLQLLLRKYPFQKDTITGRTVLEYIEEACQTYCSIQLGEEEKSALLEG